MADEQTTGTTVDGNALDGTTGTTADGNAGMSPDERQELERLRAEKEQHLAEKSNREREQQELRETRARLEQYEQQRGGYQPPTMQADPQAQLLQQGIYALRQRAAEGDPEAVVQLQIAMEANSARGENAYLRELITIPDSDRAEVEKYSQQFRVSPTLAKKIRDGEKYEDLQKRMAEKESQIQRSNPIQPTPTAGVPVPNRALTDGGAMTDRDFFAKTAALEQKARDGDKAAERDLVKLVRGRDSGSIKIVSSG